MALVSLLFSLPVELEIWLILGYVLVVLAGAWLAESLARVHFQRAAVCRARLRIRRGIRPLSLPTGGAPLSACRRAGEPVGCLPAPASSCNGCCLKSSCTPHDEGRHLYRPLAAWAETDVGRFHRRLSLLMVGVGTIFSLGGLARWTGQPGTGLLLLALVGSIACVIRDLHAARSASEPNIDGAD